MQSVTLEIIETRIEEKYVIFFFRICGIEDIPARGSVNARVDYQSDQIDDLKVEKDIALEEVLKRINRFLPDDHQGNWINLSTYEIKFKHHGQS